MKLSDIRFFAYYLMRFFQAIVGRTPRRLFRVKVMVGVVFRASGPPMFRCLFCGISWPMLCCYWFRWANFHNGRHQCDLQIL